MKQVTIRQLQHNLTKYLEIAKTHPLLITKYGREEALLVNPEEYEITEKPKETKDIMKSKFIGMHAEREDWQGKTSEKIAQELREKAWYGEK